jgi:hypothetical protein
MMRAPSLREALNESQLGREHTRDPYPDRIERIEMAADHIIRLPTPASEPEGLGYPPKPSAMPG